MITGSKLSIKLLGQTWVHPTRSYFQKLQPPQINQNSSEIEGNKSLVKTQPKL
uniref:Uncharacterized protein n=1 Tax=Arion vulgaris TaxID=1028688 RepID=A0A0B7AGG5_9EUPU